ncbi:hypothetical protein FOZ63_012091 [Perkinsus olseni]|uniref:Uncharacterized protein n=1 Tax=Perkinsus olseni TaxID=32597 RepID=A0A7J6R461_PEROL|nr:hypothetical protein FOZ63_012091 [Perkinsus olseni]
MNSVILKITANHFIQNKLNPTSTPPKKFRHRLYVYPLNSFNKFRHRPYVYPLNSLNMMIMNSVIPKTTAYCFIQNKFSPTSTLPKLILNDHPKLFPNGLTRRKLSLSGKPLEKFRHRLRLFAPNSLNVLIMNSVILKITANHFIPNKLSPTATPLKVILDDFTLHKLSLT